MSLGQRKLFTDLIEKQKRPTPPKGRNAELDKKRNEMIAGRYTFYLLNTEKRYEAIIGNLKDEFCLEEITISRLLSSQVSFIKQLKTEKPPVKFFKEKWPHLVWAA